MKRTNLWLCVVAGVACLAFSTALLAGEASSQMKIIRGKVSKVACDKATIEVSGVSDASSARALKLPDLTLKLNEKTKLTNGDRCEEIEVGMDIAAAYVETDTGNVATEIILNRVVLLHKRSQKIRPPEREKQTGPEQAEGGSGQNR